VIAATNHEQLLDPALWRRFDQILMFHHPSVHEIRSLLAMKLKNFPRTGFDLKMAAARLKGMSHADVERVCFDAIKAAILQDKDAVDKEIFDRSVEQQRARLAITQSAAERREY
jgi:AAA+ superfamily predicted ATPase